MAERFRTRVALLAMLLMLASTTALAAPRSKADRVEEVLAAASRLGQFNGAALVAERGTVVYKKGFGFANMEWKIPNTPDTKFRLASITKQFTAMLVMQLVEEGKVKLDGTISDYLPDYRKDTGSKVTIRHLLTHTSGIPSYTGLPGFMQNEARNPYAVGAFVTKFASGDLEFEPGTKWSYNNSAYFILGAIVERVTGKSYAQAVEERVFEPLGMASSGYDLAGPILEKRASGYQRGPGGYQNAPYLDMTIPYAAGSLYSTVEDLYLWDQALYTDKLLPKTARDVMFTPVMNDYAFGWGIQKLKLPSGKTVSLVEHTGGIHGFNTIISRYVDDRHLVVLLDNAQGGQHLDRLARSIAKILYDEPYEVPKPSVADAITKVATEQGGAAAVKAYRELKATKAGEYDFGEDELNRLGYMILGTNRPTDAIEVFKLNVEMFPAAANPYDSLGEAYMVAGEKALAIANYTKSLELNPANENAKTRLKLLTEKGPEVAKVDPSIYDAYVGEYQLAPDFSLTVTREGDKLMTQATGQGKVEIFPISETEFFPKVVDARIVFVKDDQGRVTKLILRQNGREMPAPKVK